MDKLHNRRQVWSWAFYDWANSSFTTIVLTFVYSAYFTQAVAGDPVTGASLWGYALAASGLGLALLGPLCGALADHRGGLKRWTGAMMAVCIISTLVMGLAVPNADGDIIALVLVALVFANIGFELSIVFNNALLPSVAHADQMGRASSLAWGIGYFGGLASLVVVLFGLIGLGDIKPLLEMPRDEAEHIRACVIIVAIWYLLFSLPFFLFIKERAATDVSLLQSLRQAWASLKKSVASLARDRIWRNFMLGSALYRDGLATLFAMGGIYAAARYDLDTASILIFGIGINVTAGIGCVAASLIEDRVGSLRTVRWSLIGLMLLGVGVLLAPDRTSFFVAAILLGLFVGPVQSASRTLVARLSRPEEVTEHYGLYALTGRAVAFLGPLAFGLATDVFTSQRAGMATILLFWLAGFMLMRKIQDRK